MFGMLGMWQSRAGSGATESGSGSPSSGSPLASQLQQAWLQSQIQSPRSQSPRQSPQVMKIQKRGVVQDVSAEKGHQQFHQVASDLSSIVADHAGVQSFGMARNEELYFHKSRHETPEFPKRPVFPQLVSYSKKQDLPQRSRSGNVNSEFRTSSSALSCVSSQRSGSLSPSCSFTSRDFLMPESDDTFEAVDSPDDVDALGLAAEAGSFVRFLDSIVDMDENAEEERKLTLQEDLDYQAIAKELDDLIQADGLEIRESESTTGEAYDNSWTTAGFVPTEESVTDKFIHAYTCNLNKHVTDVSGNVDASTWINERDVCTDHSDSSWDWDLECIRAKSGGNRRNTAPWSSFHGQDFSLGRDMSLDAFTSFTPGCVDLKGLLLRCALVVSQDDVRGANDLIRELRHHSSAYGNSLQRMAYYYMEALVAKMSGTGAQLYTAISSNTPSTATMLKANRLFVDYSPYIKVSHFFSTKSILDAFEGAERVHLVDYGVDYGLQWPCLIQRLSQRKEGPPHLRITCIDLPQPGNNFKPSARVKEVGRRLEEFAKLWGVPFEFEALADKWESITAEKLCLKDDEVLAVNCQYRLRNLLDESIMAASPRKVVLDRIRSMNPKVFVMLVVNANYNAPFFMTRFRESMKYYSTMFDAMEVSMPASDPDRIILEKEFYGREILNIVACDGLDRVERAEPYRQWQSRTQRAGFSQKALPPVLISKIQSMMGSFHKDYGVGEDGGWFLMGWKNQIVRALTVWEPTPATSNP
ncbi:hypothetical protein KC19_8G021800 [Ceratodon purpureus]|uniref:Uncharacterized protein n=1 Tax=Ceratodon purpureus TaxID=3225 RepID=A0A8T0GYW7_CERPU|nr:hypothetical protein KC19_8G021800 [Ceratodon purpureus]